MILTLEQGLIITNNQTNRQILMVSILDLLLQIINPASNHNHLVLTLEDLMTPVSQKINPNNNKIQETI